MMRQKTKVRMSGGLDGRPYGGLDGMLAILEGAPGGTDGPWPLGPWLGIYPLLNSPGPYPRAQIPINISHKIQGYCPMGLRTEVVSFWS